MNLIYLYNRHTYMDETRQSFLAQTKPKCKIVFGQVKPQPYENHQKFVAKFNYRHPVVPFIIQVSYLGGYCINALKQSIVSPVHLKKYSLRPWIMPYTSMGWYLSSSSGNIRVYIDVCLGGHVRDVVICNSMAFITRSFCKISFTFSCNTGLVIRDPISCMVYSTIVISFMSTINFLAFIVSAPVKLDPIQLCKNHALHSGSWHLQLVTNDYKLLLSVKWLVNCCQSNYCHSLSWLQAMYAVS